MDDKKTFTTMLKKGLLSALNAIGVPILAVLTAAIIGGLIIASAGGNPFDASAKQQSGQHHIFLLV